MKRKENLFLEAVLLIKLGNTKEIIDYTNNSKIINRNTIK